MYIPILLFIPIFEVAYSYSNDTRRSFQCACGKQPEQLETRIAGGEQSQPHAYPWVVGIFARDRMYVHCGGALITDLHVLSAGHCFKWDDKNKMALYLGLHSVKHPEEGKKRLLKRVHIHESFTSNDMRDINDIAIVTMDRPVRFNDKILPVCLPPPMAEFEGRSATVVGWGRLGYQVNDLPNELREAEVRVYEDSSCRHTKLPPEDLEKSMMCAYADGRDGCQGDSGGPLHINAAGRFIVVGIVSWGIECALENAPGVYTKVSYFIDWINQNTADGNTCAY